MSSISASAGKDFSAAKNNAISSSSSEEETACHSATIYASEDDPLVSKEKAGLSLVNLLS